MHSNLSPTGRVPSQPEIQRIAAELPELRVQLQKLREARRLPEMDFSALEARRLSQMDFNALQARIAKRCSLSFLYGQT